jgi:predicted nucleic acid-binding protein
VILVDTSVWIDHFRRGNRALVEALEREDVLTHPFVIGEIACGELKRRREILELLAALPSAIVASDDEAMGLIERRRLMGKGLGYVDVHLLASAALTHGARLWTLDKRLAPFAGAAPES